MPKASSQQIGSGNLASNDETMVVRGEHSIRAWFGKNADGQIIDSSMSNDGTAHFSGIDGVGDGIRNLTDYALARLGLR